MLLEIFQYDFMNRALIIGFFTAISTAILGNFVVTARQATISDMLAHTALVGVGLGVFWQVSPTYLALLTTIVSAILLWWLLRQKNQAPEAISMLLLTGGLATALWLTHLDKNNPVSLDTYLFGSILTVTESEMYTFMGLNLLIITLLIIFWRPFLTLVFNQDFLQTQQYKTFYEIFFMILIALVVGVGLKVIGGLLIGALLVIPALISQSFTHSFRQNVWCSILANILAVTIGIMSSFYLDIPASSGIVLSLILLYAMTKIIVSIGGRPMR